jgi:putative RNA 2'-phosphotransferase
MRPSSEQLSKRLAFVLRHEPGSIGIELERGGWVDLDALVGALRANGVETDRTTIEALVTSAGAASRYEIHEARIRAAQGHSVEVDLGLEPSVPPEHLYHGTVERFLDDIRAIGLRRGERSHVHLSPDVSAAQRVGRRRGEPVVLRVDALAMHHDGHEFIRAANGVWLVDEVPATYIDFEPGIS